MTQSVDCKFANGIAYNKITNTKTNVATEQEIPLGSGTVIITEQMVGWLDLMYRALPLETGKTIVVPTFNPNNFQTGELTIEVRPETEEIQVGEENHTAFVCDVSPLNEIHYISKQGHLVKIERTDKDVIIKLGEPGISEHKFK